MEIIKISPRNFKKVIEISTKLIKEGKVLVCPTDTVYGLIADAKNEKAVEKIFKIKKRPKEKVIPIFVKDIKMAKNLAWIDENQEEFLKKVWPGKVTVILKPKRKFPKGIGKTKSEIGLRVPNSKFLIELLKKIKRPIAQTSANISGQPVSANVRDILKQFGKEKSKIDLIIDGGKLSKKPSIVIDLIKSPPKILRK